MGRDFATSVGARDIALFGCLFLWISFFGGMAGFALFMLLRIAGVLS